MKTYIPNAEIEPINTINISARFVNVNKKIRSFVKIEKKDYFYG